MPVLSIVHQGSRFAWSYQRANEQQVAYKMNVDGRKATIYIKRLDKDHFQYLQKHQLIEQSGMSFEIRPSYEYCKQLIDFGSEFFSKLYSDLYPRSKSRVIKS